MITSPIGRQVGDYRLIERLGRGGMGTVHRAVHRRTGEEVALKTVAVQSEHVVQSIRREIRALMRIRHPGVVRIVADGLVDGLPWYAMELVVGHTLGQLGHGGDATASRRDDETTPWTRTLADPAASTSSMGDAERDGSALPFDRLIAIARALCDGLAHLHGEGIVHGDLKPDNVILRADDYPVIVDFGLASELRAQSSREALDARASLAGTAAYMAPESIRGDTVDARADLYALGCILFELATGKRPFEAYTVAALLRAHLAVRPPAPSHVVPGLPAAFDRLVLGLMQKEPRDRLGHAADVARLLEQLGAPKPAVEAPPARDYLYRPGFVGRRAQMASLRDALSRARAGAGGMLLVAGESGIGKTRLVNELGVEAATHGFSLLVGQCTSEAGRPLEAFQKPLERLGDRYRAVGPEAVLRVFGARAAILAPYEPSLAHLPGIEGLAAPPSLPADAARLRVFQSIADVLAESAADEPVALVIDDLHWADGLTVDLLQYLARELLVRSPVLVVASYRSEESPDGVARLHDLASIETVELGRLDASEVADMVGDMLAHASTGGLARYVADQSEGNPFFVAEYLRAALEVGLLHRDDGGRWRLDEAGGDLTVPLPSTVRALVERRLEDLSQAETSLVRAAAVLGREASIDLILATGGLDEEAAYDAVGELVRRQVLEDAGGGALRFSHDKLREVPYEAIGTELRRELHGRAARAISAAHPDDPPHDVLARHWLEAGEHAEAVETLHHAGADALAQSAYGRAADRYREALSVGRKDDPRRADWEHGLADALLGQGDVDGGQRHLLASLEQRGLPAASRPRELAGGIAGQVVLQAGHRVLPRHAVARSVDRETVLGVTRTYQRLVETYWFRSDVPPMVHAALQALNFAERAGPSPELARAYATMCLSVGSIPIHRLAEHYAALALRTAETLGDPSTEAYTLFINSVYRVGAAKWARVEADLGRAAETCARIGDIRFHGESLTVLGMSALYRGDFARADGLFERVGHSAHVLDNLQHRTWSAIGRAEAQLRLGHVDLADAHLESASSILHGPAAQDAEVFRMHGLWATCHLARGDLARALGRARLAEERLAVLRIPTAHYLLEGYAGVALARLAGYRRALGEGAPVRDERSRAHGSVRAMRVFAVIFRIGGPRAAALRGLLSWIEGDRRAGRARLRRAAALADGLGMQHEARFARDLAARCEDGRDPFGVSSPR